MESKPKEELIKKNEKFKIQVTFDKNGKNFQEVAESILLRKISEN